MSYILEALKKAEAERNGVVRKAAPLLPPLAMAAKNSPAWRRPLPWAAFAALAITLASAAWFAVSRKEPVKDMMTPPVPVQATAAPVPVAPPPAVADADADEPEKPKAKPALKKPAEKKRPAQPEGTRAAKAAPPPEPAVGTLQDLPDQVQREIPALTVAGYIYSGNKADRSVLINNRLMREGDEAAPGLVLEKMTPSGMVLNYKGYRYRRSY